MGHYLTVFLLLFSMLLGTASRAGLVICSLPNEGVSVEIEHQKSCDDHAEHDHQDKEHNDEKSVDSVEHCHEVCVDFPIEGAEENFFSLPTLELETSLYRPNTEYLYSKDLTGLPLNRGPPLPLQLNRLDKSSFYKALSSIVLTI